MIILLFRIYYSTFLYPDTLTFILLRLGLFNIRPTFVHTFLFLLLILFNILFNSHLLPLWLGLFSILYYIILYYIILYYIILYYIILYYIILYYIILYYFILYCIILYYFILYCIVLYYKGVSQLACKPSGYTHNVGDPLISVLIENFQTNEIVKERGLILS